MRMSDTSYTKSIAFQTEEFHAITDVFFTGTEFYYLPTKYIEQHSEIPWRYKFTIELNQKYSGQVKVVDPPSGQIGLELRGEVNYQPLL